MYYFAGGLVCSWGAGCLYPSSCQEDQSSLNLISRIVSRGEKHTLPSAPISVLGKNFSKPPSKGLEAAEVGPVPCDARGSTRTHNGIEHHPSWHPNLRSGSSLPTGLPALLTLGCSVNSFRVAAGLGFEPRLTDPLEPFSFTDRSRHRDRGRQNSAFIKF